MSSMRIGLGVRIFFAILATIGWIGIFMSGLAHLSWVVYVPTVILTFAAIVGICPGLALSRMIARESQTP